MPIKQIRMDEDLYNQVAATEPSQDKMVALNNAVAVFLRARKIVERSYKSAPDDAIQDLLQFAVSTRKAVLKTLEGKFSRPELIGMIDAFNGVQTSAVHIAAKSLLVAEMEDAETYNGTGAMHQYDTAVLLKKIESLSELQAEVWLQELTRFWVEIASVEGGFERFSKQYESGD